MRFYITKTHVGLINTDIERARIKKAFRNDPDTRKHLTKLMDAIENQEWKKAWKLLNDKWWKGMDSKQECSRREFIGPLNTAGICTPELPAIGFDRMSDYGDLVWAKTHPQSGTSISIMRATHD